MDKKNETLVSVIIPTFNSELYVKVAVESVLLQAYRDVEVIVVDDGSTDGTRDVLKEYIDSGEIKYIYQKNNGPASARNSGIKNSSGEFIAFLDADDIWLSNKLERQISLFDSSPDVGLVYSDMEFFGAHLRFNRYSEMLKRRMCRGRVYKELVLENFIPTSTVIVRRNVLDDVGFFDDSGKYIGEDYDLWLRVARKYEIDFVEDILVKYRIHSGKMSLSRKESYSGLCRVYKREFSRAPFFMKFIVLLKYIESRVKYFLAGL